MKFIETLLDVISGYTDYFIGFFIAAIEVFSSLMSAGSAFVGLMLLLIILIKLRKLKG